MFSQKAIQNFLRSKTHDFSYIKKEDKETLLELIKEDYPNYRWKTNEPFTHQLASLLLGIYNPHFFFFLHMGAGKSRISIDIMNYLYEKKDVDKTLILVPNIISGNSWGEQIDTHSVNDFKYVEVVGTKEERQRQLMLIADIYIMTYTSLQVLFTEKVKTKKGNKLTPLIDNIKDFSNEFQLIIMDETHLAKSSTSLTFKILKEITKNIPYRYGLTGTPMSNPLDLWSQYYLIDKGETLNPNFFLFRDAFFTVTKNKYWGGYSINFKNNLTDILNDKIKNKSIRYSEKETNELPPLIIQDIYLDMPMETRSIYTQLKDKLLKFRKDYEQVVSNFHKMRMCCGGFIDFKESENSDKKRIIFHNNPKTEAVMDIINKLPPDEKIVISYEYTGSGDEICKVLEKNKIKYTRLYSETKDKTDAINKFKKDPKYRVIVLNSKSGGVSINLQNSHRMIIYELPTSPIIYQQLIPRIYRTGQTEKTFIYILEIKDSIDIKVKTFLLLGKNYFNSIIEGKDEV